jgi:hypothetical protein
MPKQQKGGSQFKQMFHAQTVVGGPAAYTKAGLEVLKQTPMFNPLSPKTVIPGPSGIVPSGLYLGSAQKGGGCPAPVLKQLGGMPTEQLRDVCNANDISCRTKKGGFKHRTTLIKQLAGAFSGLYAPQPGSNQPGFHPN